MDWIFLAVALAFVLIGLACVIAVALQGPGGWLMYGIAIAIQYTDHWYRPDDAPQPFPWWTLVAAAILLLLGELLEFLAGVLGAARFGATRPGMIGALIGGIAGMLIFPASLIAIPVIGPIVGVFVGALVGTFAGALIAEVGVRQSRFQDALRPAFGAALGRLFGTVGKVAVTFAAWAGLTAALLLGLWR